jgi:hypothetical protein
MDEVLEGLAKLHLPHAQGQGRHAALIAPIVTTR